MKLRLWEAWPNFKNSKALADLHNYCQKEIMTIDIMHSQKYNPNRPLLEQLDGKTIKQGSSLDKLRKSTFKKIIRELHTHFNAKMSVVPCKEHLFEKAIKIEKALFRSIPLKNYSDPSVIRNTVRYVANQHKLETVKI